MSLDGISPVQNVKYPREIRNDYFTKNAILSELNESLKVIYVLTSTVFYLFLVLEIKPRALCMLALYH